MQRPPSKSTLQRHARAVKRGLSIRTHSATANWVSQQSHQSDEPAEPDKGQKQDSNDGTSESMQMSDKAEDKALGGQDLTSALISGVSANSGEAKSKDSEDDMAPIALLSLVAGGMEQGSAQISEVEVFPEVTPEKVGEQGSAQISDEGMEQAQNSEEEDESKDLRKQAQNNDRFQGISSEQYASTICHLSALISEDKDAAEGSDGSSVSERSERSYGYFAGLSPEQYARAIGRCETKVVMEINRLTGPTLHALQTTPDNDYDCIHDCEFHCEKSDSEKIDWLREARAKLVPSIYKCWSLKGMLTNELKKLHDLSTPEHEREYSTAQYQNIHAQYADNDRSSMKYITIDLHKMD